MPSLSIYMIKRYQKANMETTNTITTHFTQSANDSDLNTMVSLLINSQTNCSVLKTSIKSSNIPIYVHDKYPILSKIITNKTITVFYNQTLSFVEQFLLFLFLFFYHYLFEITNKIQIQL